MNEVSTIGLDIAKNVFHVHGADATGQQMFSRRVIRTKLLAFFMEQLRYLVATEACGGAHHRARELQRIGHDVRLIPPAYVKPIVKRNKNDAVVLGELLEAELGASLPQSARTMIQVMFESFIRLDDAIGELDTEIIRRARQDDTARRLMTIPGIGPIAATAIIALAPPAETFKRGRDLAARMGLTPRQMSTGGK